MPESWPSRLYRWKINLFPAYRGTGARVTYVADDFREIHVELRLSWRTRNAVGTIFGGSLYGSVDPFYMLMLMHALGSDYVVWDKAAFIRFKRPGRTTLFTTFRLDEPELQTVRDATADGNAIDRIFQVELKDKEGIVHAAIEKTIYVKKKGPAQPSNTE